MEGTKAELYGNAVHKAQYMVSVQTYLDPANAHTVLYILPFSSAVPKLPMHGHIISPHKNCRGVENSSYLVKSLSSFNHPYYTSFSDTLFFSLWRFICGQRAQSAWLQISGFHVVGCRGTPYASADWLRCVPGCVKMWLLWKTNALY